VGLSACILFFSESRTLMTSEKWWFINLVKYFLDLFPQYAQTLWDIEFYKFDRSCIKWYILVWPFQFTISIPESIFLEDISKRHVSQMECRSDLSVCKWLKIVPGLVIIGIYTQGQKTEKKDLLSDMYREEHFSP